MLGNLEITECFDTMTPDVVLEGRLEKAWKIRDGKRVLIKGGSNPYQQEPLCEVIASGIAERLCIHIRSIHCCGSMKNRFLSARISLLLKRNWYRLTISCRAERSQRISRTMNFI